MSTMIFVFGSNLAGVHGAGAAHAARINYGARPGQGIGLAGHSYALPTKDAHLRSLPLGEIAHYVHAFLDVARRNPTMSFMVTRVGCGLAGYLDREIAPMFKGAPTNCYFSSAWIPYMGEDTHQPPVAAPRHA